MKKYFSACVMASFIALPAFANSINDEIATKTYDAEKIADILMKLNAVPGDPKAKPNHAKGFCASGTFEPNQDVTKVLDIPLFNEKSFSIEARYSLGGAIMSDKSKPRGLALRLQGKDELWTMVMLNNPLNFAKTLKEFGYFFEMQLPDENGKKNVEKIRQAFSEVESFKKFANYTKNVGFSSSVANTPFHSVHTFWFKDAQNGKMIPARWRFEPIDGIKYLSEDEIKTTGDDYLVDKFQKYVKTSPVVYKMYFTFPNDNDELDSTNALWEGDHKEIFAGTLKVAKYEGAQCNPDVYFPSDLPSGVEPPKDELFDARNEAYAITFARRQ